MAKGSNTDDTLNNLQKINVEQLEKKISEISKFTNNTGPHNPTVLLNDLALTAIQNLKIQDAIQNLENLDITDTKQSKDAIQNLENLENLDILTNENYLENLKNLAQTANPDAKKNLEYKKAIQTLKKNNPNQPLFITCCTSSSNYANEISKILYNLGITTKDGQRINPKEVSVDDKKIKGLIYLDPENIIKLLPIVASENYVNTDEVIPNLKKALLNHQHNNIKYSIKELKNDITVESFTETLIEQTTYNINKGSLDNAKFDLSLIHI